MEASSSQRRTNYTSPFARVTMDPTPKYQQHHHHFARSSTVIYGSANGPREVEHPCCVLGRLCLQALTGVRR
ncbi:hypothetical protein B0O80DRAFT_436913 [Mortierella sp. GBAus27b]|nr:hypothetical protein B0O80DRAFT_436913 [Mortierella sp. GBAus27b]